MYKYSKHITCLVFLFFLSFLGYSQNQKAVSIQSHNDYHQQNPFWTAFSAQLNIIEVDVFLKRGKLYVTHDEKEIVKEKRIENMYLEPMMEVLKNKLKYPSNFQLLIDVKSEAISTIKAIEKTLKKYPKLIKHPNISFVISGNRPLSKDYYLYPNFIFFDYQELEKPLATKNLSKVAMVSTDFKKYTVWNGKGRLTHNDFNKVTKVIGTAKKMGKPFRFWGTPDSKTAWRTFTRLGVDIINTDQPKKCIKYISSLKNRTFTTNIYSKIYKPTFAYKNQPQEVKNVILLIGDGNGLSQISSATLANNAELSLTQLKDIGLIKTQPLDDFTTDSAAAGTALATGVKTNNRAIGTDANGKRLENITEKLHELGFSTGCITTDKIIGATPSAFYAHVRDRGATQNISEDLLSSKLDFFAGGGSDLFYDLDIEKKFQIIQKLEDLDAYSDKRVGLFFTKGGVPAIKNGRGNLLAETTKSALNFLKLKGKPFFIMIESAQIDSFGHANDTEGIVTETIDFDRAITEALKFADKTPGTLVLITADHETSGFSLMDGSIKNRKIEGGFVTHDHTATMVPIFAYGPKAERFTGVYENNEVNLKMMEVLKK